MLSFLFLFGLALATPFNWYSFNGCCYKYVTTTMSWVDAELHCVSEKATLVSIHSLAEETFVPSLIKIYDKTTRFAWIGLSDSSDQTTNGNENCVCKGSGTKLRWNDGCVLNQVLPCSVTIPSVCASRITCPQQ
uniref:C-type lectin domain-containing protein n=1 Tax=Sander lucioperca TaxID=283035 RepID=A0A8C9ZYK9_SANLU